VFLSVLASKIDRPPAEAVVVVVVICVCLLYNKEKDRKDE
jgi:hypothetical protein